MFNDILLELNTMEQKLERLDNLSSRYREKISTISDDDELKTVLISRAITISTQSLSLSMQIEVFKMQNRYKLFIAKLTS